MPIFAKALLHCSDCERFEPCLVLGWTFYLGGNAVKGKIEAGRYYVGGYQHGAKGYSEVSHAAFNYSKWHAYSVIVTWPFMILACFLYERIRKM